MSMHSRQVSLFILIGLIAVASLLAGWPQRLLAQTTELEWETAQNLSRSGTATKPELVIDGSGRFHLVWDDSFSGLTYARGESGVWTAPASLAELPFGSAKPQLVAAGGRLHAFWLESGSASLFYSSAPATAVANAAQWREPLPLADGVLAATAAVDGNGILHLAMLRATVAEAGLFYQQSTDEGVTWGEPALLYASTYYRLISRAEAHLALTANDGALLLVWDDRPFNRLLLRRSVDNGRSWTETVEMGSDVSSDKWEGQSLILGSSGQLHLVWRSGPRGSSCTLYHQWSVDGGVTWSLSQPLPRLGCPELVQLVRDEQALYLLAGTNLLLWQATAWSGPQQQPALGGHLAAESGRRVSYNCGAAAVVRSGQLVVAACGRSVGQDIWLTSGSLAAFRQELLDPPAWREPAPVATAPAPDSQPAFSHLQLLADDSGRFHAFWIDTGAQGLYYARYEAATGWSRPLQLAAGEGPPAAPSAALAPGGLLLLAWSAGPLGDLYFSRANVAQSLGLGDWATPQRLPLPQQHASAPHLLVDAAGMIHLAYAVPLNEQRGIYLTRSADVGESWDPPERLFDAVAAGWEMVDQPRLAYTGYDRLHLLWLRRPLPGNADPATLYYARATGSSWSSPLPVVTGQVDPGVTVTGSALQGDGNQGLYRVWRTAATETSLEGTLWHQYSEDEGQSWSRPARVSGLDGASAGVLAADTIGQMHLVALGRSGGSWQIRADVWQADSWQTGEARLLPARQQLPYPASLAAAVAPEGQLAVLLPGQLLPAGSESAYPQALLWTARQISLPETRPTPRPTVTPSATPLPEPTATPGPQPTATLTFPTEQESGLSLTVLPDQRLNQMVVVLLLTLVAGGPIVVLALLIARRRRV